MVWWQVAAVPRVARLVALVEEHRVRAATGTSAGVAAEPLSGCVQAPALRTSFVQELPSSWHEAVLFR